VLSSICSGAPNESPNCLGIEACVSSPVPEKVLVAGCGYVGLPLARHLLASGCEVSGLKASLESAERLKTEPFPVYPIDISTADFSRLPNRHFDVVIHCASSGRGGAESYRAVFLEGTENLLSSLDIGHLLFAGSSSVYAQTDGSLVSEESLAAPERETGQILLEAENLVLRHAGTVARLAGLYGPGRCVPLDRLLDGTALLEGGGHRIMNSLHQADAVNALAFLAEAKAGGIFNITDNEPVSQLEWFEWVCNLLGPKLPAVGPVNLDRKRGWTDKRVSNQKLRALGWEPRYPSFREGITEILAGTRYR
jgi:nucleoside-diphosphate-sugar epimerase